MSKKRRPKPQPPTRLSVIVGSVLLLAMCFACFSLPKSSDSSRPPTAQPTIAPTRTDSPLPATATDQAASGVHLAGAPAATRTPAAANAELNLYTVTANALNLRAEADRTSSLVAVLGMCQQVTKLDQVGTWLHVRAGSDTGYVSAKYVAAGAVPCVTFTPGPVLPPADSSPSPTTAASPVPASPTPTQPPTPVPPRVRIGATCNDGTGSGATGSGACSHHGGVRCWRYSDGTCTKP